MSQCHFSSIIFFFNLNILILWNKPSILDTNQYYLSKNMKISLNLENVLLFKHRSVKNYTLNMPTSVDAKNVYSLSEFYCILYTFKIGVLGFIHSVSYESNLCVVGDRPSVSQKKYIKFIHFDTTGSLFSWKTIES